ncbi:hypothetical protein NEUTE2DRAFT_131838 [Neurospora tetrasperma FGSC 2509]|nr:hypothetical protein NEUTE2DRAFT_131838 [Neurospora tetrasperma FGSC 2509]
MDGVASSGPATSRETLSMTAHSGRDPFHSACSIRGRVSASSRANGWEIAEGGGCRGMLLDVKKEEKVDVEKNENCPRSIG